jgi:vancomycin resistance protein VanJ
MAVEGGATIMIGDLNFTDQNKRYIPFERAGLIDAFRAAGWGFGLTCPKRTWPGKPSLPLTRIDYVFVTGGFYPVRAWVGPDGGPDNLPVLAILAW